MIMTMMMGEFTRGGWSFCFLTFRGGFAGNSCVDSVIIFKVVVESSGATVGK